MTARHWGDLTTRDFHGLDPETTVVVLPIAAIEQHGPHLPVSTDTEIARGMVAETVRQCPADLDVLILPIQNMFTHGFAASGGDPNSPARSVPARAIPVSAQSAKPVIRMRVISGSSLLKWAKTSANLGSTKMLMTTSAMPIAKTTMAG